MTILDGNLVAFTRWALVSNQVRQLKSGIRRKLFKLLLQRIFFFLFPLYDRVRNLLFQVQQLSVRSFLKSGSHIFRILYSVSQDAVYNEYKRELRHPFCRRHIPHNIPAENQELILLITRKKLGIALWGTEPVNKLVEHVQRAEHIGFESVWVIDSQLLCRDVFVTMAACLAQTSRIILATGVTNATTRHVSVTASALATLAEIYPGRVIAGVGAGFSSLSTIGRRPAKRAELEAFTTTLRALLKGEGARFGNDVSGSLGWLTAGTAVPVVIAASGPKTTEMAGRSADGVILLQGVAPDLIERGLEASTRGRKQALHPTDIYSVTCWAPLGLGATSQAGHNNVRARVASALMQARLDLFSAEDRDIVAKLKADYDNFGHASSDPTHAKLVPDYLVRRYAISGSPGDVAHSLRTLLDIPGLDRVVLTAQGGQMTLGETLDILENESLPLAHV